MNDLSTIQKPFDYTFVVSKVDVAHSLTQFRVLQTMPFFGWRLEYLTKDVDLLCKDRQFSRVGVS